MCGRYALTASAQSLSKAFDALVADHQPVRSEYNIAPTDVVPIVRPAADGRTRLLVSAHWGLLPYWERDRKAAARRINARVETAASARSFAEPIRHRRCLVPAAGWYEWRRFDAGGRTAGARRPADQPYFVTAWDGCPLAFAGIWSPWRDGTDVWVTFSVLTTQSLGPLAEIHDRMPLLLPPDRWSGWLSPDSRGSLDDLLVPPPLDFVSALEIRPVGRRVGDVRNGGPELVARVSTLPLGDG